MTSIQAISTGHTEEAATVDNVLANEWQKHYAAMVAKKDKEIAELRGALDRANKLLGDQADEYSVIIQRLTDSHEYDKLKRYEVISGAKLT